MKTDMLSIENTSKKGFLTHIKYSAFIMLLIFGMLLTGNLTAFACDACKQQQPKFLQGVTHGPGPGSNWDYLIVIIMVLITLYSFYAMIKCLVKPTDRAHKDIKNIILNS